VVKVEKGIDKGERKEKEKALKKSTELLRRDGQESIVARKGKSRLGQFFFPFFIQFCLTWSLS
jgi:hypothetical protein